MSELPVPIIHRWSVDHDMGWLRVDVHFPSPVGKMKFFRVFRSPEGDVLDPYSKSDITIKQGRWSWARATVDGFGGAIEGWQLLSQAVLQHPLLSKIADHFGIEPTT